MHVFVVVDDVVFVLSDDVHGTQNVERVVDPALDIFKIHLLTNLKCEKTLGLRRKTFCTSQESRLQFMCL